MNALYDRRWVVDEVRANLSENLGRDIFPRSGESEGFKSVDAFLDADLSVCVGVSDGGWEKVEWFL